MVWDPTFSPDGKFVVAKVEIDGRYSYVINGRPWNQQFDNLWDPVFSPDGGLLLVRGICGGKYERHVLPISELVSR
jgi:hypothetical protein